MQNKSLNPADSCVQMQRSRSQPARAPHSPAEMSVHFIPSEAGISEAFRESSSLHRCPLRGVRWPFQLISPGKHDRISLKFRKWPLLMRFKKQDKTKQQKKNTHTKQRTHNNNRLITRKLSTICPLFILMHKKALSLHTAMTVTFYLKCMPLVFNLEISIHSIWNMM